MTDENETTENPELELPNEEQIEQFGNPEQDESGDEGVAFATDADQSSEVIQKLQDDSKKPKNECSSHRPIWRTFVAAFDVNRKTRSSTRVAA